MQRFLIASLCLGIASPVAAARSIPEPMRFDLVRGLDARAGEVEVNVLASFGGSDPAFAWAPEIEWVPFDGLAFELEVQLLGSSVESLKPSLQWTAGRLGAVGGHGLQVSTEFRLDGSLSAHGVYVLAVSPVPWLAVVASGGARLDVETGSLRPALLLNLASFVTFGAHAAGVELVLDRTHAWEDRLLLPQVHVSLGAHARMQLGAGLRSRHERAWEPNLLVRFVVER